jgi:hypothetical protein
MAKAQRGFFVVFAIYVVRRAIAGPSAQTTLPEVTLRKWTPRFHFPAVMDVTFTPARLFSDIQHICERDGETWMWLAGSGASHHMTSVRRDFCEYRALTYRLLVKGINARTVGVGSAHQCEGCRWRGDSYHAEECAPRS